MRLHLQIMFWNLVLNLKLIVFKNLVPVEWNISVCKLFQAITFISIAFWILLIFKCFSSSVLKHLWGNQFFQTKKMDKIYLWKKSRTIICLLNCILMMIREHIDQIILTSEAKVSKEENNNKEKLTIMTPYGTIKTFYIYYILNFRLWAWYLIT